MNRPVMKWGWQNPEELARQIDEAEKSDRKARELRDIERMKQAYQGFAEKEARSPWETQAVRQQIRIDRATTGDTPEARTVARVEQLIKDRKADEKFMKEWNKKRGIQTEEEVLAEYKAEVERVAARTENAIRQGSRFIPGAEQRAGLENPKWEAVDYTAKQNTSTQARFGDNDYLKAIGQTN